MPFKFMVIISTFLTMAACSTSAPSAQAAADTSACNAMSYGNNNTDIKSMDDIFNKGMADKKSILNKQYDEAVKRHWFDFFSAYSPVQTLKTNQD